MFGRLLINIGSPTLFDSFQVSSGGIDTHSFPLPNDLSLVGRAGATQAICYTNASGTVGQFLNAIDVTAGTTPLQARPSASFAAASTSGGPAPLTVAFVDNSTGPITSYTTSDTEYVPEHLSRVRAWRDTLVADPIVVATSPDEARLLSAYEDYLKVLGRAAAAGIDVPVAKGD